MRGHCQGTCGQSDVWQRVYEIFGTLRMASKRLQLASISWRWLKYLYWAEICARFCWVFLCFVVDFSAFDVHLLVFPFFTFTAGELILIRFVLSDFCGFFFVFFSFLASCWTCRFRFISSFSWNVVLMSSLDVLYWRLCCSHLHQWLVSLRTAM